MRDVRDVRGVRVVRVCSRSPSLSRYNFASKCVGELLFPHTPFTSGGSPSFLARPFADGSAAGVEMCMGLPAPHPGQVKDLHLEEIAQRNFPYAG